jgi:hypothetical protein
MCISVMKIIQNHLINPGLNARAYIKGCGSGIGKNFRIVILKFSKILMVNLLKDISLK